MIASGSIRISANGIAWLIAMAEWCSTVYMGCIFFAHSSADGRLGCPRVLAAVDSAAVATGARVGWDGPFPQVRYSSFTQDSVLSALPYMEPGSLNFPSFAFRAF